MEIRLSLPHKLPRSPFFQMSELRDSRENSKLSEKGQIGNILGFLGHCMWSLSRILLVFLLKCKSHSLLVGHTKQAMGQIWLTGCSSLTLDQSIVYFVR